MPQQITPREIAPYHYQTLTGAVIAPLGAAFGNQFGDAIGTGARHLLFGNTPQEDLAAAEAAKENQAVDFGNQAAYKNWDVEHQGVPEADKLAAAQAYHIKDATSSSDARLTPSRTLLGQGRLNTTSIGQDGRPAAPAGSDVAAPPAKVPFGMIPSAPEEGEGFDPLGVAHNMGASPAPQTVVAGAGGIGPSDILQQAQASQAVPPPPVQMAPSDQVKTAEAQQNQQASQMAVTQAPMPPLSQTQQVQGQALIQQIGARLTGMTAAAQGQYTPTVAASLSQMYDATSQSVGKMADLMNSVQGTGGNPVTFRDVVNSQAFQIVNNPELFAAVKNPNVRAQYVKQADEFAQRDKILNSADRDNLARLTKIMPMDPLTFQSSLAGQKLQDEAKNSELNRQIAKEAADREANQFQFTQSLRQYVTGNAQADLDLKRLGIDQDHPAQLQRLNLQNDVIKQDLRRTDDLIPILKNKAVLDNLSAATAINEAVVKQNLGIEEFKGTMEQKAALARYTALGAVRDKSQAEIDKIMGYPAWNFPGKPHDDLATQVKVLSDQRDAAVQSQIIQSQANTPGSLGPHLQALQQYYNGNMEKVMHEVYLPTVQKLDPVTTPWESADLYKGRTSLVSTDPKTGATINNLPKDIDLRKLATLGAAYAGPKGQGRTYTDFINTQYPDGPNKGKALSEVVKDKSELSKAFTLYRDFNASLILDSQGHH